VVEITEALKDDTTNLMPLENGFDLQRTARTILPGAGAGLLVPHEQLASEAKYFHVLFSGSLPWGGRLMNRGGPRFPGEMSKFKAKDDRRGQKLVLIIITIR
jgi:hypothetical protein